jgi:hypothetical protein
MKSGGSASGSVSASNSNGCGGATPVSLTVLNFEAWCSVAVAGGSASLAAEQTVCVAAGTVDLSASAASSAFELGAAPWRGTSGDNGSGDPGTVTGTGTSAENSTTVVVTTGSVCVAVCCPFSSPAGTGCPTTNPCA